MSTITDQNKTRRKNQTHFIDKDIRAFFLPLDLPHFAIFQSKYKSFGSTISENGCIYKCLAFLATISIIPVLRSNTNLDFIVKHSSTILSFTLETYFILLAVALFVLFLCNTVNSASNVQFVIKLQAARRSFINCECGIKTLAFRNWIFILVPTVFYVATQFVLIVTYSVLNGIVVDFVLVAFDFVIVYAIRGMTLLRHCLNYWVKESKIRNVLIKSDEEDFVISFDINEMYEAYCDLADALLAFKEMFSVPILVYLSFQFLATLVLAQGLIMMGQNNILELPSLINIAWGFKSLILIWLLGLECDLLYSSVQDVNDECLTILAHGTSQGRQNLCKNILRINSVRFTKVTASSLFLVDNTLIVRFADVYSTYFIVLLQLW